MARFTYTAGWKGIALMVLVVPLLLSLGSWQLQRAEEKRQIQRDLADSLRQPAVLLTAGSDSNALQYRRIKMRGHYLQGVQLLLDNRFLDGVRGFDSYAILCDEQNFCALVNRGWLPIRQGAPLLSEDMAQRLPSGAVEIAARVDPLIEGAYHLKDESLSFTDNPIQVVQYISLPQISAALGRELAPIVLRVTEHSGPDEGLRRQWSGINVQPEKHTSYAVQWFAFAVVACVVFLFATTNIKQIIQTKKK